MQWKCNTAARLPLLAALAVSLSAAAPPSAPTLTTSARAVVDDVIAAYGGEAAVALMARHRAEGTVGAKIRGGVGYFMREFVAPGAYRTEIRYPEATEQRVLTPDGAWRGKEGNLVAVQGLPRLAMVYQLLRSTVPWVLAEYRDRLVLAPPQTWEGRSHDLLTLRTDQTIDVTFWVERESRRVVRVQGVLTAGSMSIPFETRYSDFRQVDGLWLPFREMSFANDRNTGTSVIEKFGRPESGGTRL